MSNPRDNPDLTSVEFCRHQAALYQSQKRERILRDALTKLKGQLRYTGAAVEIINKALLDASRVLG